MIKISVFLITKNESDRIFPVLQSIKDFADEILVIDSGSEDDTKKIAESCGAKVIFNKWQGFGQQKIFGENACKNDWILNIDADEELSQQLAQEILKLKKSNNINNFCGYRVKIVNKFRFEKKPKKWAYYYNQLRLYNKNHGGFRNSSVHDSVVMNDDSASKIGQLKNIIHHQSFRSYQHWIEKINYYSEMQAKDSIDKNKKISHLKILLIPSFAFIKAYFVRRYFIYGFKGLIYSYLFAFSRFAKAIKHAEKQDELRQKS